MKLKAYLAVYRLLDDGNEHARNMRNIDYCRAVEEARQWRAFAPGKLAAAVRAGLGGRK